MFLIGDRVKFSESYLHGRNGVDRFDVGCFATLTGTVTEYPFHELITVQWDGCGNGRYFYEELRLTSASEDKASAIIKATENSLAAANKDLRELSEFVYSEEFNGLDARVKNSLEYDLLPALTSYRNGLKSFIGEKVVK